MNDALNDVQGMGRRGRLVAAIAGAVAVVALAVFDALRPKVAWEDCWRSYPGTHEGEG